MRLPVRHGVPAAELEATGLSLSEAGLLVSAPVLGVLLALVGWGALTDRVGERGVLTAGLSGAALALAAASVMRSTAATGVLLIIAGASGSCAQVASGRLTLGWFGAHERGLAMGLRQSAQPLGIALAALVLPRVSGSGPAAGFRFLSAGCAAGVLLTLAGVHDPDRRDAAGIRSGSPYRGSYLWRLHLASALLVVPQFTVSTFGFDYLVDERGWAVGAAGTVLATAAVAGAGARLGAGWWSDRVGNRLGPMRLLALVITVVLGLLAVCAALGVRPGSGLDAVIVILVALAAIVTVSTNGLSFTAVAERAGRPWAGRALGVQNTVQNMAAAATPPVLAVLITAGGDWGYPAVFSCAVAFPLAGALLTPVAAER